MSFCVSGIVRNYSIKCNENHEVLEVMTYGDGVCDVNLKELLEHHKIYGKLATLTAVQPDGRFGIMDMNGDYIVS